MVGNAGRGEGEQNEADGYVPAIDLSFQLGIHCIHAHAKLWTTNTTSTGPSGRPDRPGHQIKLLSRTGIFPEGAMRHPHYASKQAERSGLGLVAELAGVRKQERRSQSQHPLQPHQLHELRYMSCSFSRIKTANCIITHRSAIPHNFQLPMD